MERFKGTPAPRRHDEYRRTVKASTYRTVCIVPTTSNESNTNANLIAAAPELLEVLIKISEMQKLNYGNGMLTHIKLEEMVRKADLVISKALGE